MQDKQRVWGFFAHANIIVGMMFVVFFVIDRFNPAMEFLTSSLSKWLMLFLAVSSVIGGLFAAVFLFQKQKRRDEKRGYPQIRTTQEYGRAQHPQPYYNPQEYSIQQRQQRGDLPAGGYRTQTRPISGQPYEPVERQGEWNRQEYAQRDQRGGQRNR